MVAGPNPVGGFVESQRRGAHPAVPVRVRIRGSDEDVVDPPPMAWLAHDFLDLRGGVGIVGVPRVARPVAGDRPRVVEADTAAGEGLPAGEITHAGRVR